MGKKEILCWEIMSQKCERWSFRSICPKMRNMLIDFRKKWTTRKKKKTLDYFSIYKFLTYLMVVEKNNIITKMSTVAKSLTSRSDWTNRFDMCERKTPSVASYSPLTEISPRLRLNSSRILSMFYLCLSPQSWLWIINPHV